MTSSADQTPAGYNIIMAAYTIYVPLSNARCCLQYRYTCVLCTCRRCILNDCDLQYQEILSQFLFLKKFANVIVRSEFCIL